MEGILRYSHYDLIEFFGHQLVMKTGTNRKRLLSAYFSEIWMKVLSLVRVNRDSLDYLFQFYLDTTDQANIPYFYYEFFIVFYFIILFICPDISYILYIFYMLQKKEKR